MPTAANDNLPDGRAVHSKGIYPFDRIHGETLEAAALRWREIMRLNGEGRFRAPPIETPFDKAIRDGRVNPDLALTAGLVEMAFEKSSRRGGIPVATAGNPLAIGYSTDPLRPVGPEITTDANRELQTYETASGECWCAIVMAVMQRATMFAIGIEYGFPIRRAGSCGLGVVLDGLRRIDRDCFGVPAAANDNSVGHSQANMIGLMGS